MKRTLLLAAVSFLFAAPPVLAQQPANDANPVYRRVTFQMHTIVVPPIAGIPFSATAVIENKQTLPDGTVVESRNINLIGRDSRGRTHGEQRQRIPLSSNTEPPLLSVSIYDPQTEMRTTYTIATHIATEQHQSPPRETPLETGTADPLIKVEDLGASTIEGIDVKGTRRSVAIRTAFNTGAVPITIVDEYWYSEDLHVNMALLHNDPRTGEQKIVLTEIKREDPEPSFFQVPEGYKIVDLTPPEGAPVLRHSAP
jgi:hypothetical protein